MIDAVIAGGAGYAAGELLRLLLAHPEVRVRAVQSTSHAGGPVASVHRDLEGECDLAFSADAPADADVIFLCLGHGGSRAFLDNHAPAPGTLVVDLAQDFRVDASGEFVYGLPELNRDTIAGARANGRHIANPGCFATALQLALLPLAHTGLIGGDVHASAITGSTGAGHAHTHETHFSWRHANTQVYKPFTHQHLAEVRAGLRAAQSSFDAPIRFIPYRGGFTRGILASVYTACTLTQEEAGALYRAHYAPHPFTFVSAVQPDLKQVVNTNRCAVHVHVHDGLLLATAALDNLLKGAAGQAVQNMNLAFGFDESTGLRLKAGAY